MPSKAVLPTKRIRTGILETGKGVPRIPRIAIGSGEPSHYFLRPRSKAIQKDNQIPQLRIGKRLTLARVAVGGEDFLEGPGPAVVQEGVALGDSSERRWVEPGVAVGVAQADVDRLAGCEQRGRVAAGASGLEQGPASFDGRLVEPVVQPVGRGGRWQRFDVGP